MILIAVNKTATLYAADYRLRVKYKVVGCSTLTPSPKSYGLLMTFSQIMFDYSRLLLSRTVHLVNF